jgi:branched-chain amino acid transport system substrate-binding protein
MTSWTTRALLVALGLFSTVVWSQPVVVGAVVSQTGAHAEPAEGYRRGLLLWQDEVNAAGGLLGRPIDLRLLDDASTASANASLYERLIRDERASLLIGPYGTAATLLAATTAERARHVLLNGGGPSAQVHRRSPRFVFQTGIPYGAYGSALLALAQAEGVSRLFVLAHDDTASKEMAGGLRAAAVGDVAVYGSDVVDFKPFVEQALAARAVAWIAFGGARDAADMVRTFRRLGYAPRLFFARGATDGKFIAMVGQDAVFTLTSIEYVARLPTPGNDRFVRAYTAKWSAPPGASAAEGYAAGQVAAAAVRRAASLDQEKLREALAWMRADTVLGGYKANAAGEQTAARPTLAQVRGGRVVVLANGERPVPYPAWSERKPIK